MDVRIASNMIYRILVDYRHHVFTIKYLPKPTFVLDERVLYVLASGTAGEREAAKALATLKETTFGDRGAFIEAALDALGRDRLIALEQRLVDLTFTDYIDDKWVAYPFDKSEDKNHHRLVGASYGRLADIMSEHGLRAPSISNPRARFYFTEFGWLAVGRHVDGEARRLGHVVKIIREKNPSRSQIVYEDRLQMAILQPKKDKS